MAQWTSTLEISVTHGHKWSYRPPSLDSHIVFDHLNQCKQTEAGRKQKSVPFYLHATFAHLGIQGIIPKWQKHEKGLFIQWLQNV